MKSASVGTRVRVRGYRQHATVEHLYTDIKGGVRLDREIGGFMSWNVADLVLVRRSRGKINRSRSSKKGR